MSTRVAGHLWRLGPGLLAGGLAALCTGCASIPSGVTAVRDFDAARYMGTWYEIARLDHRFERGLTRVTAEYALREDGRVTVVNRGFDARRDRWREIEGVARFRGERTVGQLSVTFFWPFSGAYNVIALDRQDYRYALVCGPNRSYLWILAREPELGEAVLADLVSQARRWGFDVDSLIYLPPNRKPD